ncbi:MAG: response regulator [Alphaproteobacteria bacterium]|nr:response regulator [Alphaproteobacteria bacterium]MBU2378753.1 response regulator [Alphaproteobacteria bacterium]
MTRILLVDDSEAMRRLLSAILTAAGFQVVAADGVREGLRRLRTFSPDVVLTDFNMPSLDGEAFARLLRRDRRFVDTPILVVSSETGSQVRRRMEAAGANGWLGKPVDPDALVRAVRSISDFANPAARRASPRPPAVRPDVCGARL